MQFSALKRHTFDTNLAIEVGILVSELVFKVSMGAISSVAIGLDWYEWERKRE